MLIGQVGIALNYFIELILRRPQLIVNILKLFISDWLKIREQLFFIFGIQNEFNISMIISEHLKFLTLLKTVRGIMISIFFEPFIILAYLLHIVRDCLIRDIDLFKERIQCGDIFLKIGVNIIKLLILLNFCVFIF